MEDPQSSASRPSFPFDADLTDILLTTLSDLNTLESFILSSKFVYNVFQTRRISVLRTLVSNHLGPGVTPQAMRLLKVMTDINSYWHGWLAPLPVNKLPREDDFQLETLNTSIISFPEAHKLAANHAVVRELESLYSWRTNDPGSSSSRLTQRESEQFQRAAYRVWFVCAMYGRPAPANRVGKKVKSKRLTEILRDLGGMQAKFLQSFESSELAPLLEVWRFLMDLATWATRAEFFPCKRVVMYEEDRSIEAYLAWSGPTTILQAFRGEMAGVDRKVVPALSASYEQFCDVFSGAMTFKQPSVCILEHPNQRFLNALTCQRCTRGSSEDLWSESNWSYLRGVIPPSEFFRFLELPWWNAYTDEESLEKICRTVPYSQLIERAFVHRSKEYKSWKPAHWLCTSCLKTFLNHNIEALCRSQEDTE